MSEIGRDVVRYIAAIEKDGGTRIVRDASGFETISYTADGYRARWGDVLGVLDPIANARAAMETYSARAAMETYRSRYFVWRTYPSRRRT